MTTVCYSVCTCVTCAQVEILESSIYSPTSLREPPGNSSKSIFLHISSLESCCTKNRNSKKGSTHPVMLLLLGILYLVRPGIWLLNDDVSYCHACKRFEKCLPARECAHVPTRPTTMHGPDHVRSTRSLFLTGRPVGHERPSFRVVQSAFQSASECFSNAIQSDLQGQADQMKIVKNAPKPRNILNRPHFSQKSHLAL